MMERFFQVLAVILIGVAAYFLWRGSADGVFVAAVTGAVCFFLSVRFQVKERLERRENFTAETLERRGDFEEDLSGENKNEVR